MARTGPRPNYGSKRRVRPDGYVDIWRPGHPMARSDGYAFEHRVVAWDAGILVDPEMQVHHRNHVRDDNRPENLLPMLPDVHTREHLDEAGCVTNQFGTFPLRPPKPAKATGRPCAGCPDLIPDEARADARFCSSTCKVRSWKRSRKAELRPATGPGGEAAA